MPDNAADSGDSRIPTLASANSTESLRRSLAWLCAVRIVVIMLILVSAVLVQSGSGAAVEISFLYRIAFAAILLSLFHWTIGKRILPPRTSSLRSRSSETSALVSLLVYSSGGPELRLHFLYVVVIGTAGFSSTGLGAVLTASTPRFSRRRWSSSSRTASLSRPPVAALLGVDRTAGPLQRRDHRVGLFGVAFMVAYLSEKLLAAREELARRQRGALALQTCTAT